MPEGGVEIIQETVVIKKLLELIAKSSRDMACHLDGCGQPAMFICLNGCDNLCLDCHNFHSKIKTLQNHKVKELDQATAEIQGINHEMWQVR